MNLGDLPETTGPLTFAADPSGVPRWEAKSTETLDYLTEVCNRENV